MNKSQPQPPSGLVSEIKDKGINLLTDTGLAIRQLKMKQKFYLLATVVIIVTVFCLLASSGWWFLMNKQKRDIESQLVTLEQQLATFTEVSRLAGLYEDRLNLIRQLLTETQTTNQPSYWYREWQGLAGSTGGSLVKYSYKGSEVTAGVLVSQLSDTNNLLEAVKEKEQSGIWSGVIVSNFSRQVDNNYQVEFTVSLTPQTTPGV